jgi:cyclic pyranopterin phosphate synthase
MAADPELTHLDEEGRMHMVEVGAKEVTDREAVAEGHIAMDPGLADRFFSGDLPKGDAAAAARLAGIMAAKRTSELIPLCHPITLTGIDVTLEPSGRGIRVVASVRATDRTGVEMEAMTAVAVAALTIYDMVKGLERGVTIETVRLMKKTGGKSGKWERG